METKTGTTGETARTDASDEAISRKVIDAVADAKGVDPIDLPPLYDSVDPDALDGLFRLAGSSASITSLRLEIADCEVLVRGSGEVEVVRSGAAAGSSLEESRSAQDTAEDSAEDRCGVDVRGIAATNTHYV